MDYSFLTRFAATYDCNAYGANTYNGNEACKEANSDGHSDANSASATNNTSATSPASHAALTNTGMNVPLGIGGGVLLVVIGVIILIKMRRNKKAN